MVRPYKVYKTAKAMASHNNLIESKNEKVFYDFSLLDEIKVADEVKQLIINQIMDCNCHSWFEQPMPFGVEENRFTHWNGILKTSWQRFYKTDGRRICVIVSVNLAVVEKWTRESIYDRRFTKAEEYTASNHYALGDTRDVEVA